MPKSALLERYYRLFDESPEPMWLFDEETLRFLDVNRAAITVYGYSREEFLQMDICAIRPPEDVDRAVDHVLGGGGLRGEWRHRTKSGQDIDVEVVGSRMTLDGRPARLVIARDVSLKLALESQLRHSQKIETVGQLAGGIAHDFNNLLTAIVGHVEVLSDYLAPGDPRAAEVRAIREAVDLAADLTRQLVAFSRKQQLQPTVLNLNDVVDRTRTVLQRLIRESIVLETRPADHLWPVRADAGQVEQIILNLAVNARDAMPRGGVMTLETANVTINSDVARRRSVEQGDYVELSVSDTGTGIPPEVRVRLFEPFFTTKDRNRGTGLGLATVYGIVKQSGGHIIVESDVGHGSKFAIYLPACAASAETSLPEHRVQSEQGSETVLVVEQDKGVRSLIGDVLRRRGYRLLVARDGPDALRVADEHDSTIHLLITSLSVPAAAGAAVAAALRERRPDTRVLFLQKPFTPVGLARKVRGALEEKEGHKGDKGHKGD
jgi:two-component system cell cycle sensor histidine kinase/response regulator CckA